MYNASDPRAKLDSTATAYGKAAPSTHFAAADYIKFHEVPPIESSAEARTWYGRGQNFIVAYTEATAATALERSAQPDEYILVLPHKTSSAAITTDRETRNVPGYSIVVLPPGDSRIVVSGGVAVRVFTSMSQDLAQRSINTQSYATPHPFIPPFQPWPAPPAGFGLRVYSLDVPPEEGRFGRIWRCTGLMVNVLPREDGPRDITRLSPHHHEDFEQCSLAIQGAFTHHIRWPWTANLKHWRDDEHESCPAPSMAVIPPPAIHTSAGSEPGVNQLIDIFSPPRMDFSKMPGWVLNAGEYPLP